MLRKTHILVPILLFILLTFQTFAQNASDEILASFTKLRDLKSYRSRVTITPSGEMAQQMEKAKSMGMDFAFKPIIQEVINPDTRKMTMEVPLMSMPSMPAMPSPEEMRHMTPQQMQQMSQSMQQGGPQMPQVLPVKMYAISNGKQLANYLDCLECEKKINEGIKQQLEQFQKTLTSSLLKSVMGGPFDLASHVVTQALSSTMEAGMANAAAKKGEKMVGLNQWTCRDRKEEEPEKETAPSFPNAKATGTAKVGTEDAKTYQFDVTDPNTQQQMPVTLYVSTASGLPMKMEMSQQQGTMTMEYYDINSPFNIELPDCMKK